jgi:DNA repair protein RadC
MNIKIKDIPVNERPRERLINSGASNLSNEELLAILLKTGTKQVSSKLLASKLLASVDDIKNLKDLNYQNLVKIKGIGKAKACLLLATFELSKRMNREVAIINDLKINNSKIIYNYYKDVIENKMQEHFYCVYLDNQKKVIKDKLLFIGTINQSLVHPREIFKEAYLLSASSIICVHNHPSGNVIPSKEDLLITDKLVEIGNLFGIKILDHIIIGKSNYYSFYENNNI